MQALMQRYRDLGLGVKLTLILLVFFGILLISLILLLIHNTQNLTQEVASEQIIQEINTVTSRLDEIQRNVETDISFLVGDIAFFQAVGRRSQNDLNMIIGRTNLAGDAFDVEIVDGDGNFLVNTSGNEERDGQALITIAREGAVQSTVTVEEVNGEQRANISAVSPISSVTGNFLGAIRIRRQITDLLLQDITAQRNDVFLALVHNDEILVRNQMPDGLPQTDAYLTEDIPVEPAIVARAQQGEMVSVDELILSNNEPYKVAYAPVENAASPLTIMTAIELSNLNAFQTQTLINTIIIFAVLTLLTLILIYITLRQGAINSIKNLQVSAQRMVEGDYDQRIPVTGKDELGQLALTFNEMVSTIQEREDSLEEARIEAERANQIKSAFLASVSHELRTPLNAIINLSGFVADGDLGPVSEEQEDVLKDVVRSGKHLLNLINDVLDMSKIETDSLQLFLVDNMDVNGIVRDTLSTARSLINDKPVELKVELADDIPPIRGDTQRITQVLLNLVSNACKFTHEGSITLATKRNGDEIIISVTDTGTGIEPEHFDSIFQAFVQTDTGIRQGGGTGLGLPISKSLVEAHNGKLWVTSEIGAGSTFHVSLPVQTEAVPA